MSMSTKDKRGVALIVGAGAIVCALLGTYAFVSRKPAADASGCVGTPERSTVVVLDHSETITDQTRGEIVARAVAYISDKAQTNERVTVFNISEASKKSLVPVFSRCKPSRSGSRLVTDVRSLERNYQQKFMVPLRQALNAVPQNSKESPIAQALIDITLTEFLRSPHNSLLVFSDMLENAPPRYSMYSASCVEQGQTVAQFKASRRGAVERPRFHDTYVELNIIPRTDVARTTLRCRDQLWPWFFGDNEGSRAGLNVDYLPGA